MDNNPKFGKMHSLVKTSQKANLFRSAPCRSQISSKCSKNNFFYSKSNLNRKTFLNNKRKDKKRNKNEIPDTPHNTGQYLSHIHQENEPKVKNAQNEKMENSEYNEIKYFEENEDGLDDFGNFDYEFVNDKKRERLMSLEGKDLENFLFKKNNSDNDKENKDNKENIFVKTSLDFKEQNDGFDINM